MRRRREARHVDADLGHDDVGADRAQARHRAQQSGGDSKRLQPKAHLTFDVRHGLVQRVDMGQVQLEHEAVVRADASAQGFEQLRAAGFDADADVRDQTLGRRLTVDDRLEHRAPALAQEVADHDTQLEVGVLQELLDALGVCAALAHELLAGTGERAQLLHGSGGHEAGADQTMREQVGQPHRIVDVGLAPGHVLHVRGVGQHQLDVAFQDVPHRLPVHAGGLHGDVLNAQRLQPVGQLQQARGGCGKGSHLLQRRAVARQAHARDHGLFVNVQARATRINDFHDLLQCAATSACGPRHRTLGCVLRGARPEATVRGARGAAGPTDIRVRDTKYEPTSLPDAALQLHTRFMGRGSRTARWSN